ncbi:MAG TPA: hypothetical protein VF910_01070 [Candidatus Bathyarchaeia archaeon]
MSADPNLKYMHPDSEEARAKKAEMEKHMASVERSEWLQLWRIYERCVDIAHKVWDAKLDAASAQQEALALEMRDRGAAKYKDAEGRERDDDVFGIPVPLFTPRDRLQFIKEVAVNLNITAGQRGLSIRFPKEWTPKDAETKQEAGSGSSVEAAPGTVESALDAEASEVASQGAVNQSSRPETNDLGVPLTT